jgi:hypothetical protein
LTDRIFEIAGPEELAALGVVDSPATRLLVDGWAAMVETVVVAWVEDPHGLGREELLGRLALSLPSVVVTP